MAGLRNPRPFGADLTALPIDPGTLARIATPLPGPVGTTPDTAPHAPQAAHPLNDPEIEALNLGDVARKAAYSLKKAHPSVTFTSGRRDKSQQASAMASNVVNNRTWIEETYVPSALRTRCQEWVDSHPEKKTQAEIAEGLVAVFESASDNELSKLSKHLSGEAFDVQPVTGNADAIKQTIRALEGLDKFLDKEGGLVRWHAQF